MMKYVIKIMICIMIIILSLTLLPDFQPSVDAASTPVLVLGSTTAVNPVMDLFLDYDTYCSGGPFTVSWEWKAVNIADNDPYATGSSCGLVSVVGSVYGSLTQQQNEPYIFAWGNTGWVYKSFSFQNVGVCSNGGVTTPGNLLRFSLWKAKGQLHIKNLVIRNAVGTVLYNLNTDPIVTRAVNEMAGEGLTQCDLSELEVIDPDNRSWRAGQISTGTYTAHLAIESNSLSSTTNTPTTNQNFHNNPCASGHTYENGVCVFCLAPDPDGCARGNHVFANGFCINCFANDPNYIPVSTTIPAPTNPTVSVQIPDHYYPINPSVENDRDEREDEEDDSSNRKKDNGFFNDSEFLIKIGILAGGILIIGGGLFLAVHWIKKKV